MPATSETSREKKQKNLLKMVPGSRECRVAACGAVFIFTKDRKDEEEKKENRFFCCCCFCCCLPASFSFRFAFLSLRIRTPLCQSVGIWKKYMQADRWQNVAGICCCANGYSQNSHNGIDYSTDSQFLAQFFCRFFFTSMLLLFLVHVSVQH